MADYTLSATLELKDRFSTKIQSINKASENFKRHMSNNTSALNKFKSKMGTLATASRSFGSTFARYFGSKVKSSVNVGISALNRFKSKMGTLVGNARNFGNKIGKNLSRGFNFTKNIGKKLFKAGAVVGGAGVYGIKAAGDFEALGARMNTAFGGDKEKAADYFKWANNFANVTPYSNEEVIDAAVKLKSYGYNPKRMMTMLGDWAAAYGKPLDQAIEAFADAGQGEYERLKELGLNKNKILEYAKSKGNPIAMQGERVLDQQKFMDTLQEMIINQSKDGMKNLARTLTGMFSTTAGLLKFNIAKLFGYDFNKNQVRVGSMLDWVKQKFDRFNTWMQSKEGMATIDKWAKAFDDVLPTILEIAGIIKDKFKELAGENFVDKLKKSIKEFNPKSFNDGLDKIKNHFDSLLKTATRFFGITVGIELGKVFGVKGMLAGAVIGGFLPEILGTWKNLNDPNSEISKMFGNGFSVEKTHEQDKLQFEMQDIESKVRLFQDIREKEKYHELLTEQNNFNNETFENKIKNQSTYNYNTQNNSNTENNDNSYSRYNSKVSNQEQTYYSDVKEILNNSKSLNKYFTNTQNNYKNSQSSNYENSNSFDTTTSFNEISNKKQNMYNLLNTTNENYSNWSKVNNKEFLLNNNSNSSIKNIFTNSKESNEENQEIWDIEKQRFINKSEVKNEYLNNNSESSFSDYKYNSSSLSNTTNNSKNNVINFDKDIKVDVNIDFTGSNITLDNYEERIDKAVAKSVRTSFDDIFKQVSDGFNFGGSLV